MVMTTTEKQSRVVIQRRPLGIENGIGKAKEGIGSKGFMKRSEEENRALCDRTCASCVRTVPWESLRRLSAQLERTDASLVRPHKSEENVDF
ncbi:hypothetical protein PIB30_098775 [Stylosanthes scabra]|uniref:Uncharacterized protein n=1 Tax=Stylosanthes scabra TaxID=79078 RepID=A0ABU6UZD8_9FABA|nr:hypothetical protein [Stylosanthes scabra]